MEPGGNHEGSRTSTAGTSDGFIVGDGDDNTSGQDSVCSVPHEAVSAENGDELQVTLYELQVTLREAKKNEVETGCPVEDNSLPHAGTNTDAHIWVEDGENTGEENV